MKSLLINDSLFFFDHQVKKAVMSSQAVLAAVGYITSHNVDVKSRAEGRFKFSFLFSFSLFFICLLNFSKRTTLDNARMRKANQLFDAMAAHPRVIFIRGFSFFVNKRFIHLILKSLLLGFSYVLRKLSRWVYPFGVHISEEEAKRVLEAAKKGPILIIPTHKSHVDSVLVTLCCFDSGLPIPYVVADEGLNYPIVGSIMRACGALFLPRSFSGETDCLSKTLFQEYLKGSFFFFFFILFSYFWKHIFICLRLLIKHIICSTQHFSKGDTPSNVLLREDAVKQAKFFNQELESYKELLSGLLKRIGAMYLSFQLRSLTIELLRMILISLITYLGTLGAKRKLKSLPAPCDHWGVGHHQS